MTTTIRPSSKHPFHPGKCCPCTVPVPTRQHVMSGSLPVPVWYHPHTGAITYPSHSSQPSQPSHPSQTPTFPPSGPQSFHALQTRNSRLRRQLHAANAKNTYRLAVNRRQKNALDDLQNTVDMLRKERETLVLAVTGGVELTRGMFEDRKVVDTVIDTVVEGGVEGGVEDGED